MRQSLATTARVTLAPVGQRRPLQPGTPIQLADGQQIKGVDFRLPRVGVITGHVFDEGGDPIVGATVRVLRYQYRQGERRLNQAGITLTDDRGAFRVWGLNPGSPSANAMVSLVPDAGRGGFAINYGARSRPDGTFRIADVPPGRYIMQARGNGAGPLPTFASQALIVDGSDVLRAIRVRQRTC